MLDAVRALSTAELARFVPAHPMAGAESAGLGGGAGGDRFRGGPGRWCPPVPGAGIEALLRAGRRRRPPRRAARRLHRRADHDAAVARTSHVPHVAAQALSRILGNGERGLRAALAGPAWRDMTRVARSDPGLWSEILSLQPRRACWLRSTSSRGDSALVRGRAGGRPRRGSRASWRAAGSELPAAAGAPPHWRDARPAEPRGGLGRAARPWARGPRRPPGCGSRAPARTRWRCATRWRGEQPLRARPGRCAAR